MSAPSVAELIRDHGELLEKPCGSCGRKCRYRIGGRDRGFVACLLCDTNRESRKSARVDNLA